MHALERLPRRLSDTTGRNNHRFILWAVILLALGLRLARLCFQPLWWDEGWSLYFAMTSVGSMLKLTAVDIHPPFYYLLLHVWTGLFGSSALSVRLLSVLIGTATVPLLYCTGRQLLGKSAGLLAAFLLAVSPFHIYYSQEVRMYGLVTFLGLAAFYFAQRWEWDASAGWWGVCLGYVLSATAALLTQYYAAFLLLALNISALIRWRRNRARVGGDARDILPWLGAQVGVALLYLPWLWYAGNKLLAYVRYKVSVEQDPTLGIADYISHHLAAFTWGHAEGLLADWWWLALLPLGILLLCGAIVLWQGSGKVGISQQILGIWRWILAVGHWPLAIVIVSLALGFVLNLVFPFHPLRSERLLLLALPAYLLLVVAALLALWCRRRLLAGLSALSLVVVGLLSLSFFYTVPRYPDDDYRPLINRVSALSLPTDAIVNVHPWQIGYFRAYMPDEKARPTLVLTPREVLPRERQLWADDPGLMAADLQTLLDSHGRIWLPDHRSMGRVLEAQIEAYLVEHAYPVLSEWHGADTVLSLFAQAEPEAQLVTASLGEWLVLEGAALSPGPLHAGWDTVAVDLTWRLLERPGEDYRVGLRLVDAMGHVWAQRDGLAAGGLYGFDEWPVNESRLDRHGLLVPAGTPPGDYRVTLQVYRGNDLAVLPAFFEGGGGGGEVDLGTVRVVRPTSPLPVEALAVERSPEADFCDQLRFLGYRLGSDSALQPGEVVEVELFWQVLAAPGEDFLPRLLLTSPDGIILAEGTEKPVLGTYPTAWWLEGELVRDPQALPIPATALEGQYRLDLSLVRAANGAPCAIRPAGDAQGGTVLPLTEIRVQGREHTYQPVRALHHQEAQFGSLVELTGYDLRPAVYTPGSPLEVTLHWHVLQTPDEDYHTFVHLLDADGKIVAQHDGPAGKGNLPALGWLPGEYLLDPHLLYLPINLPEGDYRLGVGLYNPATGQRLGGRILLEKPISVKGVSR